jgi:hypothetical protein
MMTKTLSIALFVALAISAAFSPARATNPDTTATIAAAFSGEAGEWIDLTHAFDETRSTGPPIPAVSNSRNSPTAIPKAAGFIPRIAISGAEHGGTHLDAPIHFAEGRHTSDEIATRTVDRAGGGRRRMRQGSFRLPASRSRTSSVGKPRTAHCPSRCHRAWPTPDGANATTTARPISAPTLTGAGSRCRAALPRPRSRSGSMAG